MSTELKKIIEKDLKKRNITPKTVIQTVKNSINGIICYAKDGKSIILYLVGLIFEIIMGIVFNINGLEWILIICIMGILLSVELLNTAIEATVDMVTQDYNEYAKIAKDCGSAATGIMSVIATIVNMIIFMPYIIEFILKFF